MINDIEQYFEFTLLNLRHLFEGDGQGNFPSSPRMLILYSPREIERERLEHEAEKALLRQEIHDKASVLERITKEAHRLSWVSLTSYIAGGEVFVVAVLTPSPQMQAFPEFRAWIQPRGGLRESDFLERRRGTPFLGMEWEGVLLLGKTITKDEGGESLRIHVQWPDADRDTLLFYPLHQIKETDIVYPCHVVSARVHDLASDKKRYEFIIRETGGVLSVLAGDYQCVRYGIPI